MMKCAILEDNDFDLQQVQELLKPYQMDIDVFSNHFMDALNQKYDVVIMDIELDDQSGIDLASKINKIYPYTIIIYITNYHQYVSDVYQTAHLFYLEKNQLDKYFKLAIDKAIETYNEIKPKMLKVSWRKSSDYVPFDDIIYIEHSVRHTLVYTSRNEYTCLDKLDNILEKLDESFLRVHKSFIVNMHYIYSINQNNIILKDQTVIPVSRSCKDKAINTYHHFLIKD